MSPGREIVIKQKKNKPRESEADKTARLKARDARFAREVGSLSNLTAKEVHTVESALDILSATNSTWLVNIFKMASSIRSRELAAEYRTAEMSFEARKNSIAEVWRHDGLKTKIYEAATDAIELLPRSLKDRLFELADRIRKHRSKLPFSGPAHEPPRLAEDFPRDNLTNI